VHAGVFFKTGVVRKLRKDKAFETVEGKHREVCAWKY
jgi:hypothetical protein